MKNKRLPHINAQKIVIDWLFSELIEKHLQTDLDEIIVGLEVRNGIDYFRRKANTRDKYVLCEIANKMLEKYIIELQKLFD